MKRRVWDSKAKAKIVLEGLSGKPISELCNEYAIAQTQYYKWRDKFLADAYKAFEGNDRNKDVVRLKAKAQRLEQIIGQLSVELKKSEDMFVKRRPSPSVKIGLATKSYTYHANTNRVKNTDGTINTHYTYDNIGNVTQSVPKSITSLAYDPFVNRTKTITMSSGNNMNFSYDGTERRVYKKDVVSSVTTEILYLHDGMNAIVERNKTGTPTEYIYGPTGLIAIKTPASMHYVIKDHLGSTRVLVNTTDQPYAITTYDYSAFGTILTTPSSSEYLYTGQEFDKTSGLHNFKARMYDSDLMRFYGVDPAGELAYSYGYGANNPLSYRDPDGKFIQFVIMGAMMGGYFGAVQADMQGKSVWEGFAKGAFVGGIGGALGGVANPAAWGGMQSVLVGAAEGVATNGLSNVLRGKNFFKNAGTAAGVGAAFGLVSSEQFGNAVRGQGWNSNEQVFNEFVGNEQFQQALDYFHGEGVATYNPYDKRFLEAELWKGNQAPLAITQADGKVIVNWTAFHERQIYQLGGTPSIDQFNFAVGHEIEIHVPQAKQGLIGKVAGDDLEVPAYKWNYRNVGLLTRNRSEWQARALWGIDTHGGSWVTPDGPGGFQERWWHFVYRIPRRY